MTITVRENKDVVIFDIEGEFRRSEKEAKPLSDLVKAQLNNKKRKFLVNLEKMPFIDSFGVGEILASYISVRNEDGVLKLAAFPWKFYPPRGYVPTDFMYENMKAALESFELLGKAKKKLWQFWK